MIDIVVAFFKRNITLLYVILVFLALYLVGQVNYLLFHSVAELFSIIVASCIFILSWNTRRFLANGYLVFVGIAYLFVAGLDLLHTLSFRGMGVFPAHDADLPTQLWIAARYLQSIAMVLALFFLRRRLNTYVALAGFSLVTSLTVLSIFYWDIFPVAYIEGVGLTPFKITSEYIISLLFLLAVILLIVNRSAFDRDVLELLVVGGFTSVAAELAFTGYVGVDDQANMAGHFLKITAFYFVYRAIVVTGFVRPYNLLFRELKQNEAALSQARDELETRVQERTAEVLQTNLALQAEIAEHRRTEAELVKYRERLEELVEARTAELQRQIAERERAEARVKLYSEQLERSNRDLQDFAYIASHDLQEPLRKVRLFGERLQSRASARLEGDERDFLERMQNAAARMQQMITDLLGYSRISTRPQPFSQVDLKQVTHEVLSDLEARLEQTGGQVQVDDLPIIEGDPLQMRQLLQNLLGNALKFHQPGTPPEVRVYVPDDPADQPGDGQIRFVVEDKGIGFDESRDLEHLFQPFHRLVGRSEYEGSGMGLAICAKIVERHGGSITARSQKGCGTAFIVTLPVRQGEQKEGAAAPPTT